MPRQVSAELEMHLNFNAHWKCSQTIHLFSDNLYKDAELLKPQMIAQGIRHIKKWCSLCDSEMMENLTNIQYLYDLYRLGYVALY